MHKKPVNACFRKKSNSESPFLYQIPLEYFEA
jgi:hypothetical protein